MPAIFHPKIDCINQTILNDLLLISEIKLNDPAGCPISE